MAQGAVAERMVSGIGAMAQQGPIDLLHLSKQALGDRSLELEVLRMFYDMLTTYMARLEASTNRSDLMLNFHAIKGASLGIGAFGLADLAATAEDELRDGAAVNPERVDDVGMAAEEVKTFIAETVQNEPA